MCVGEEGLDMTRSNETHTNIYWIFIFTNLIAEDLHCYRVCVRVICLCIFYATCSNGLTNIFRIRIGVCVCDV